MHTGFLTLLGAISAATALELDLDVTPRGRSLLEITFKELSFPTGLERHYVRSSKSAVVDGKKYHTKCVLQAASSHAMPPASTALQQHARARPTHIATGAVLAILSIGIDSFFRGSTVRCGG